MVVVIRQQERLFLIEVPLEGDDGEAPIQRWITIGLDEVPMIRE